MIYKFPKPAKLFKELLPTYKGSYIELCVPDNEDEKLLYSFHSAGHFRWITKCIDEMIRSYSLSIKLAQLRKDKEIIERRLIS